MGPWTWCRHPRALLRQTYCSSLLSPSNPKKRALHANLPLFLWRTKPILCPYVPSLKCPGVNSERDGPELTQLLSPVSSEQRAEDRSLVSQSRASHTPQQQAPSTPAARDPGPSCL